MKNLFKAIGRKAYFSFRQMAKAMKSLNILTFGAVFLAGTLLPTAVVAEGDMVRATITPTSSTIELGQSKTFSVITKLNGVTTTADTISWFVDNTPQGSAASLSYTPSAIGDYQLRVNVTKNGIPASSLATLKVITATGTGNTGGNTNGGQTNTNADDDIFIRAVVTPTSSTIDAGMSKTFSVVVKKNGVNTQADTINWFVNNAPQNAYQNLVNMTLSPSAGVYNIRVNVVKDGKPATSYATLTVRAGSGDNGDDDDNGTGGDDGDDDPAGDDFLRTVITPTSSTITLGASKQFGLVTKLNGTTINPDTTKWFVDNQEQISSRNKNFLILSPAFVGTFNIRAIATEAGANVAQSYATLIVKAGTTPPPPPADDDFVRAVITPTSSTINVGQSKTFNLITKLNGFVHAADRIEWYVEGVLQPSSNNKTFVTLSRPVGTYAIHAKAWINGQMGSDNATLIVKDVVIVEPDDIEVVIIPDLRTVYQSEETTYTAVVYDENGQNVTSTTTLDWSILDGNAVILTESHDFLRIRALNNLGTFNNIYVFASRNGETDTDTANLQVIPQNTPPPTPVCDYNLNASVYGVIEDGSSPTEGDIILYTVKVNNFRPCTLHNVNVKVGIPANTTFVSASSPYSTPWLSSGHVYWDAGTLVTGQEKQMYFRVRINNGVPLQGWYITAFGSASALEVPPFPIQSNTIFVPGKATPAPTPDLPKTGADWIVMTLITLASLGLASLTYALMVARKRREYPESLF